jgi:hypothetical protein
MSSDEDIAIVERVQIRKRPADILAYVPPKGIDITFHQVDPNETNPKAPRLYDTIIVGSPSHPDMPIEARDIHNLVAGWRGLVANRVEKQHSQPLKHKIVTVTSREKIQGHKTMKERFDKIHKDKKWTDAVTGNEMAEISGEAREL